MCALYAAKLDHPGWFPKWRADEGGREGGKKRHKGKEAERIEEERSRGVGEVLPMTPPGGRAKVHLGYPMGAYPLPGHRPREAGGG